MHILEFVTNKLLLKNSIVVHGGNKSMNCLLLPFERVRLFLDLAAMLQEHIRLFLNKSGELVEQVVFTKLHEIGRMHIYAG